MLLLELYLLFQLLGFGLVGFGEFVQFVHEFLVFFGKGLVGGLDCPEFVLQLVCIFLIGNDLFFFMFHLLVEGTEPGFKLILIVVPGEPERLQLIGEEGDLIVLVLKHVDIALVFLLEFRYFLVLVFNLSFEELNFLL